MNEVEAAFTLLEGGDVPESGLRVTDLGDAVSVAVDDRGRRLLLIETGDDAVVVDDRNSGGVWMYSMQDGTGRRLLSVECREPGLGDVWLTLAAELHQAVVGVARDERRPVVQERLGRWRRMLGKAPLERLSEAAEVGLIGELTVLARFASTDPNVALEAWTGPSGGQHDFRWGDRAVEVKTTRRREGFPVTIHGLQQLDVPTDSAQLYLAGVRVLRDPDGRTLPSLVHEMSRLVDRTRLTELLLEVGYDHDARDEHHWDAWLVSDLSFWPVTTDTPALRASTLPSEWLTAISGVSYTLELAALGSPIAPSDVDRLWRQQ